MRQLFDFISNLNAEVSFLICYFRAVKDPFAFGADIKEYRFAADSNDICLNPLAWDKFFNLFFFLLVQHVITSYSIHYTKLYEIQAFLPALLLASVVTLSGCASSDSDKEMKPDSEAMGAPESLDSKPVITEGRTDGPMLPIYFDFDSSDVRQDAVKRLENNADS